MGTFVARLGTRRAAQKPKLTFRYRFTTDRAILFQNILRLSYIGVIEVQYYTWEYRAADFKWPWATDYAMVGGHRFLDLAPNQST